MLRQHTDVFTINNEWETLKKEEFKDRNSIRVFDGDLYSLSNDYEFYEGNGCRKLINIILYHWDYLRDFALKDEIQNNSILVRTTEEQKKMVKNTRRLNLWLKELQERVQEE
mgnify:CR=1 FL=1